jgi:hypothetical protein
MLLALVWPYARHFVFCRIVLPLRSRGQAIPAKDIWVEAELKDLPPDEARGLEAAGRQLAECGFEPAVLLRKPASEKTWASASVWMQAADGAAALVMAVRTQLPDQPRLGGETVTFCTDFADGTAVETTNFDFSPYPPDPTCNGVRWPGMGDVSVLYRLHATRVDRDRRGRATVLPPPERARQRMHEESLEWLWRLVRAGYYRYDRDGDVFRPTLQGAFLAYWKLNWPWKQHILARNEQKLRREMDSVGMGSPEAYLVQPRGPEVPTVIAYRGEELPSPNGA